MKKKKKGKEKKKKKKKKKKDRINHNLKHKDQNHIYKSLAKLARAIQRNAIHFLSWLHLTWLKLLMVS